MIFSRPFRLAVFAALAVLVLTRAQAADGDSSYASALESITTSDLWRHLGYLAHDGLEGREAGSRGGHMAGDYLAAEMERIGLQPAGDRGGYIQWFAPNFRNIVGMIEGADPVLKREVIAVCAHYDHVGYGTQRNSRGPIGYVHNGADDNASGTSGALELAEAFMFPGARPHRSLLFLFTDAEEKGLLGARHWSAHPTIPIERIVFGVNLDMIGRVRDDRLIVFGWRSAPGLRRLICQHNESGLRLEFPWLVKGNADHYAFFERGIPVVLLTSGEHEDYHRPSDDVEKINVEGERRVLRLAFSLVYGMAQGPELPRFREAARQETPAMEKSLLQTPVYVTERFGAAWDDDRAGPVLTKVTPASPAEKAGLTPGDRVARFGAREIRNAGDLTQAVRAAPKQTPVRITVVRPGEAKPVDIQAELDGEPVRVGITWRLDDAEPGTVILSSVLPESPAAAAGLMAGDRILKVAGRQPANEAEFAQLVRILPGPLEVVVERDGRLLHLAIDVDGTQSRRAA